MKFNTFLSISIKIHRSAYPQCFLSEIKSYYQKVIIITIDTIDAISHFSVDFERNSSICIPYPVLCLRSNALTING